MGRRERVRRRSVMVRIADDQRTVGAAHDDQMHSVGDVIALLRPKALLQRGCGRQLRIAEISDHAEVGHDGGKLRVEALRRQTHHVQLAARQAIRCYPIGAQRVEVVARADDDRLGFEGSPARLQPRRRSDARNRLAPERYAETLGEIMRQPRDRLAQASHPHLVGAEQRARELACVRRPCP